MGKNRSQRRKNLKGAPVFWLIVLPLAALAVSGLAVYKGIHYYLTSSDYFRVREVSAIGVADDRYVQMIRDELAGANIFKVDVFKLAGRIRRKFPTFYEVRVRRILPSELRIVAEERVPVAVVHKDRFYAFDADGVALAAIVSADAVSLPLVEGVAERLPKVRIGFRYNLSSLRRALTLAAAIESRREQLSRFFPVVRIVVGSNGALSFTLRDGLEVKVRDRRFEEQLDLLPAILRNLGADLGRVAYLDMRPREPVVGMRSGGAR
jgi:cell division septal protein FtsQ